MKKQIIRSILIMAVLIWLFPVSSMAGAIEGTVKVRGLRSAANILVYLPKAPNAPVASSENSYVMDQRNLAFLPHILTIPVGASIAFPNNDEVDHNVFSLSRTKKFNLGSYKPGDNKTITFDKPGIVELRCDMHAEMLAYIMVLKNSFYTVTDKNGNFKIADIAPGQITIKTWHEKLRNGKLKVTVPDKGAIAVQLNLTRGTPGVLYK